MAVFYWMEKEMDKKLYYVINVIIYLIIMNIFLLVHYAIKNLIQIRNIIMSIIQ